MKPGVYKGLTDAEYNAIPAVRSTVLRKFAKATPAHWKLAEDQLEREPQWAGEGRALHIAVLQPDQFARRVASRRPMPSAAELGFRDFRTNAARELRDSTLAEIEAEVQGYEIVLEPDEMERVTAQADVLHRDPTFRALFELPHETELTIVWEDAETGLPCKARLDAWFPTLGRILELKGTKGLATVDAFGREMYRLGYHQQCGWYLEGAKSELRNELRGVDPIVMAVSEKSPPYLCAVRPVDIETLQAGYEQVRDALQRFAGCKKSNRWPSHDPSEYWTLPRWALPTEFDFEFAPQGQELP